MTQKAGRGVVAKKKKKKYVAIAACYRDVATSQLDLPTYLPSYYTGADEWN